MDDEQIDSQLQETEYQEFKTNTARFGLWVAVWVGICLLFVDTPGLPGMIIIAIIALAPSISKKLFHSMTVREHDIEYRLGWLTIRRIQIPFDNISTVDTEISMLGRWLGYGTITVLPNNGNVNIRFKSINEPEKVKQLIEQGIAKSQAAPGSYQPTGQIGVADEISKLQQLKSDGTITNDEFDSEKSRLLNR